MFVLEIFAGVPAAQAALEDLIRKEGLDDRIQVDSTGTDAYHSGEAVRFENEKNRCFPRCVTINHRSRQLQHSDILESDLLIGMAANNVQGIRSLCRTTEEESGIRLFRDFDPQGPGDVPDPWYGGPDGFETVWEMIERTSPAILDEAKTTLGL